MARCKNGGEVVWLNPDTGEWEPDADEIPGEELARIEHTEHAPRQTVVVEPATKFVNCAVCAWGSNYATLRVGDVDVCDDHAVSAIKLQHAMMTH